MIYLIEQSRVMMFARVCGFAQLREICGRGWDPVPDLQTSIQSTPCTRPTQINVPVGKRTGRRELEYLLAHVSVLGF